MSPAAVPPRGGWRCAVCCGPYGNFAAGPPPGAPAFDPVRHCGAPACAAAAEAQRAEILDAFKVGRVARWLLGGGSAPAAPHPAPRRADPAAQGRLF